MDRMMKRMMNYGWSDGVFGMSKSDGVFGMSKSDGVFGMSKSHE